MGLETIIPAGASLLGGMMQSDAAESAANTQAGASAAAAAEQRRQYDQIRSDLSRYRNNGGLANDRLAQLLGLGSNTSGGYTPKTAEQLRQELIGQYTRSGSSSAPRPGDPGYIPGDYVMRNGEWGTWTTNGDQSPYWYAPGGGSASVDEVGLQSAIERALANQPGASSGGPVSGFGSLLTPFTGADLQNEPGYQFGLRQGLQAQDNAAARAGSLFSGTALKAAQRYGQDYGGTKFNEAFNRDAATKDRTYNFLSGMSTSGQNAANMTGQAGQNMSNQVANNITSLGNAQGAAQIAQGNAWGSAINGAVNNYQNDQLLQRLSSGRSGGLNSAFFGSEPYPGYNQEIGLR